MATIFTSMPNVAPSAVNVYTPPILVNTSTSVSAGNGSTVILTPSTVLPAGTYLVGGNFGMTASTTFTNTDAVYFRVYDTAGSLVNFPQTLMTGYTANGSAPAAITTTVTGVLILATAGTLTWGVNCAFTSATGKTASLTNAFYQRIS